MEGSFNIVPQANRSAADQSSPLVTIVMPTYNRMPLIIEAVYSVIAQTHSNWELFIMDDGSNDGTVTAIKNIGDPRIKLIEMQHTGTARGLRNAGAEKGTGEWICFLDSDDTWFPRKLELQLKALRQTGFECCYTNFELMDIHSKAIPGKAGLFRALSGNIIRELISTEVAVTIDSLMVSRRLFNKIKGFSTDPRLIREDYELELRLALQANMVALPDVLVRVREHTGRTTNAMSAADAHLHSALPYEMFISQQPGIDLEQAALAQYKIHMSQAAKISFWAGNYRAAFIAFKKSVLHKQLLNRRTADLYSSAKANPVNA